MKKTIEDYPLSGKKVIIRCDFNVPMKNGIIQDDTRIVESLKTITYATKKGAKVILLSHLGKVKTESDKAANSLLPVSVRLSELLHQNVSFVPVTRGKEVEEAVNNLHDKDVLLIQNTRYEDIDLKKESSCEEELSIYWASLADIFINDAFGTIHRRHASNCGIAKHLPNGIGFLVKKELEELDKANHPEHPYVVMLGGAKVTDKIGTIQALALKADTLLIGGGMSYTFLKAKGKEIGTSLVDIENISFCQEMLEKYGDKIILPVDIVVGDALEVGTPTEIVSTDQIPLSKMGLDIGPKTVALFQEKLIGAKTILWNGPVGVYEIDSFAKGTKALLETLAKIQATTILGGGDMLSAASKFGVKEKMTHASTGGGATLEYLEGKVLPGLAAIEEKEV